MVKFIRVKGMTQESVASKTAEHANKLIEKGFEIISITQYADSASTALSGATIYYK